MSKTCESCGRNHDRLGAYCENCVDENENLKSFDEVRESLAKHISETQGYADVAASKIADSILAGVPKWKSVFEKREMDKKRLSKKKDFTKIIMSFIVGLVVMLILVLSFGDFLGLNVPVRYTKIEILSDLFSSYVYINNDYVIFARSDDDVMVSFFALNKSTKKEIQFGDKYPSKKINWNVIKISDDYFVWTYDKKFYVWDFENDVREVVVGVPEDYRLRRVKLFEDWLAFDYSINNADVEVYALSLSDSGLSAPSMKVETMEPYLFWHVCPWRIERTSGGEEVVLRYESYFSRKDPPIKTTMYLESNVFVHTEFKTDDHLFDNSVTILERFRDKILYKEEFPENTDISGSNKVSHQLSAQTELFLYDVETHEIESLGVFPNFREIDYKKNITDKFIFISTDPGYKDTDFTESSDESLKITDEHIKKTEYYYIDFETSKLHKCLETIEEPLFTFANNSQILMLFENREFEKSKICRFVFDTKRYEVLDSGSRINISLINDLHIHEEDVFLVSYIRNKKTLTQYVKESDGRF